MKKHGKGTNTLLSLANWGGGNLWHRSSRRKLRAFGISSPFILLSCSQKSMTATFLPWSTVLLFSSVSSKFPPYLHCMFHRQVWNTEVIWISCLCVCWQAVQPNRNGSVVLNSWCWHPDIHIICGWGGYVGLAVNCGLGAVWKCIFHLTSSQRYHFLYTLRLLHNVNHSIVNGTDLKEKYSPTVN